MENQFLADQQLSIQDLRACPPHLTKLLMNIPDVLCAIDEQGIFTYVGPNSAVLFGYSPEEMTGASFLQFIHPADRDRTLRAASARTPGCTTSNFCNRYVRKDASIISVIWSARWDEQDRRLYCVARDASENEEVHQRLVKAQQMARVANFEFDVLQNRYTYVSHTLFEIFGLDPDQFPVFTTDIFWSLVHPEDLQRVRHAVDTAVAGAASTMEYRILRPDGRVVYINRYREVVRDTAGRIIKTIGTIQDITERKITEMALRRSEERFRSLVQNGSDLLGIIDEAGNYTFVGANVQELLGVAPGALEGRNVLEFIHPQDAELIGRTLHQIKTQKTITVGPFRFQNGSGAWRWMETTATNHLDNPAIQGITLNSRDITEKKAKDDALALSEQRFKALVHDGSDIIVILDRQHCFAYLSDNVAAILGYAPTELIGRCVFDYIHIKDMAAVQAELRKVYGRDSVATGVQHRFLHKGGGWIWLESKGTNQLENSTLQGVLVNARNIHDRVKLQRRLNQELLNKQKEITAAVIKAQETERSQMGLELHDNVNQVLATVKLYTEMYLSGYVQGRDLLVRSMEYIQECINEIRSISKRLSAPTMGSLSLGDSILELTESINLTRQIKIGFRAEGLEDVEIPEDLHLAVYRIVQEGLNNILKYAQASSVEVAIWVKNQQLGVLLSDNGVGFDLSAKRTGIGITNMRTRAENLNASFIVDSKPGKGCRIKIVFPLETKVAGWCVKAYAGGL